MSRKIVSPMAPLKRRSRRDPDVWIATHWLRADQRNRLEDVARKIRTAADYQPSNSQLLRIAIDTVLESLERDAEQTRALKELAARLDGLSHEKAGEAFELWLRERLTGKKGRKKKGSGISGEITISG